MSKGIIVSARARPLARGWHCAGCWMTAFSATGEKVIEDQILHARPHFDMRRDAGSRTLRPVAS